MPAYFESLRSRLLEAGVKPRHVTRYLNELREHLEDLIAKEEGGGQTHEIAIRTALAKLGSMEELAQVMLARKQFRSWTHRAPCAVFILGPLVALVLINLATLFLPELAVVLVGPGSEHAPIQVPGWFSPLYSTITKFDLYVLPLLCGWALSVLATRHRMSFVWPIIGFSVIAVFCGLQSFNVDWASAPNQLNSFGTTWAFLPGVPVTTGLVFQVLIDFVLVMAIFAYCNGRLAWISNRIRAISHNAQRRTKRVASAETKQSLDRGLLPLNGD